MTAIKMGIDVGNGTVGAVCGDRSIFFPSFVAKTRRPYQGNSGAGRHYITYRGVNYVIGADALDMANHNSLMGEALAEHNAHKRYLRDDSFAALLAAASALYPSETHLDIDLGTGAPISVYEPHGAAISARYEGAHSYEYMGITRTVNIQRAKVFGEGVEAIRLLTPEQQAGKIIIHDIGGRTYGAIYYNNGAFRKHHPFNSGIDRLFSDIAIMSADPGARWLVQSEMRANPKAHPAIRAEISRSLVEALEAIETKIRIDQADRHIVMGGGAVYAAPVIKARYSKPVVVLNREAPEMVNAIAYARAIEVL